MLIEVKNTVTIESILAEQPQTIFYSARSCWWTHDPKDLYLLVDGKPLHSEQIEDKTGKHYLPCDPRGMVLFHTDDAKGFLNAAQQKPEHYGAYQLETFLLAHSKNLLVDGKPFSFESWTAYDAILRTTKTGNVSSFEYFL